MRSGIALLLLAVCVAAQQTPAADAKSSAAAASAAKKLDYIVKNGARSKPDRKPTVLTEEEVNAYFAAGMVALPQGVHAVQFTGTDGVVVATTDVNFDEVKEGRSSSNPLLYLFTGTHKVKVTGNAAGTAGKCTVHIQDTEIDGIAVPRLALELFVDHFLKPKYPNVGLDTTFALPDRIDTAVVGKHVVTITQK